MGRIYAGEQKEEKGSPGSPVHFGLSAVCDERLIWRTGVSLLELVLLCRRGEEWGAVERGKKRRRRRMRDRERERREREREREERPRRAPLLRH